MEKTIYANKYPGWGNIKMLSSGYIAETHAYSIRTTLFRKIVTIYIPYKVVLLIFDNTNMNIHHIGILNNLKSALSDPPSSSVDLQANSFCSGHNNFSISVWRISHNLSYCKIQLEWKLTSTIFIIVGQIGHDGPTELQYVAPLVFVYHLVFRLLQN